MASHTNPDWRLALVRHVFWRSLLIQSSSGSKVESVSSSEQDAKSTTAGKQQHEFILRCLESKRSCYSVGQDFSLGCLAFKVLSDVSLPSCDTCACKGSMSSPMYPDFFFPEIAPELFRPLQV